MFAVIFDGAIVHSCLTSTRTWINPLSFILQFTPTLIILLHSIAVEYISLAHSWNLCLLCAIFNFAKINRYTRILIDLLNMFVTVKVSSPIKNNVIRAIWFFLLRKFSFLFEHILCKRLLWNPIKTCNLYKYSIHYSKFGSYIIDQYPPFIFFFLIIKTKVAWP